MNAAVEETRAKIADLGALMFARHLTDMAGGNISARVDDVICITPRYAGSKFRWQLRPEQVLVADLEGNQLEGEGEVSREARVHVRLLNEFPDGKAVVHGHAQNALVFCAAGQPIPPVLEDTLKFGEVKVCAYAPAHSPRLAENIVEVMRGQEARVRKQAAAVLAPWHGLFVLGKDLDAAIDAAERIDINARCILFARLLEGGSGSLDEQRAALMGAFESFK
jgi:L-fuculose-phosphate aldolase